jgi:PAS domain S-box-containing protein
MDSLLDSAPCGFLSFTDDGAVLAINATLLRWLGFPADALVGRSIERLLPVASRIFYQTHFFPLLKLTGKVEEVYFALRTAEGEDLPVLVNAARREENGAAVNDCVFIVVRQRNRYEDEILHARRTAEEAQSWLSTTLQSIGDAVIATDVQGRVVFANPVAEALTGWSQAQAVGRPLDEIFTIVNEETGLAVPSPVLQVLRDNTVAGLANHTVLVARDGCRRPIDDSAAPIRSGGETLGVVLVFRDVTERRQTEQTLHDHRARIEDLNEHLQRAMTETHHRVKNNLQVISALVDMQIETDRDSVPSSELRRISQHIRGLAVIHDLLTHQTKQGGEAERLSVRDTLERLLPLLQGMTRGRTLHFTLEDAIVPIRQATSLAVLVNELVSNATKHGTGDIGVVFKVRENRAVFEVWDEGEGFPIGFDPASSANTGLELVETIGRHDLRGEISYSNRSFGRSGVVVDFPLG